MSTGGEGHGKTSALCLQGRVAEAGLASVTWLLSLLGRRGIQAPLMRECVPKKPSQELSRFSGGVLGEVSAQKPRLA